MDNQTDVSIFAAPICKSCLHLLSTTGYRHRSLNKETERLLPRSLRRF